MPDIDSVKFSFIFVLKVNSSPIVITIKYPSEMQTKSYFEAKAIALSCLTPGICLFDG